MGRLDGLESMTARIALVAQNLPQRAAAALYQEAEAIMATAKARTPVLTGILRASGYVSDPMTSGGSIGVELGFGGAAAEYATYVHEIESNRHAAPTGAKFLEDPLKEAAPQLAERIGRRIILG